MLNEKISPERRALARAIKASNAATDAIDRHEKGSAAYDRAIARALKLSDALTECYRAVGAL